MALNEYSAFNLILRGHAYLLDNTYNYQFKNQIEARSAYATMPARSDAAPFATATNAYATMLGPDDHHLYLTTRNDNGSDNNIAWLASKTKYKPHKIELQKTYDAEHPYLIFCTHGRMYYFEVTPEKIVKLQKSMKNRKYLINDQQDKMEWFNEYILSQGMHCGWGSKTDTQTLQASMYEKKFLITVLAIPQVGFVNFMALINVTLSVIASTLVTPYYLYVCHVQLEISKYKERNGGRPPSDQLRIIIERDGLTIAAQAFAVTGYAAILMRGHILKSPDVYLPIEKLFGNYSSLVVRGLPIEVHIAVMLVSAFVMAFLTIAISAIRNYDNPRFGRSHYGIAFALGFFTGIIGYAATMISSPNIYFSSKTVSGIFEILTALAFGAGLHKLAAETTRREPADISSAEQIQQFQYRQQETSQSDTALLPSTQPKTRELNMIAPPQPLPFDNGGIEPYVVSPETSNPPSPDSGSEHSQGFASMGGWNFSHGDLGQRSYPATVALPAAVPLPKLKRSYSCSEL